MGVHCMDAHLLLLELMKTCTVRDESPYKCQGTAAQQTIGTALTL